MSGPLVPWLCLKHMPMLLRALATTKGVVERESGRGKEEPCSKAKKRESPKVEPNPRRKKGDHSGEEQGECYRCGTKGHWSHKCHTPRHLVDLYQQSKKGKGQHESHLTAEPEAQECNDMNVDASGGDVRMGENEDNLLDDIDVFGDLH